jgi:hypothetical protein
VILPHTQLLAAHPQLGLVAVVQSRVRYAAMSVPSTPLLVTSAVSSRVPWAGVSRKSEQLYVTAPASTTSAVPPTSFHRKSVFIVGP